MKLTTLLETISIAGATIFSFVLRKPKLLYFGAATYGNVGDLAISVASEKLLREKSSRKVIVINDSISVTTAKWLRHFINSKDVVAFQGGGNFGDLYPKIEGEREAVFTLVQPKNPVLIQMPTSINFENSNEINLQKIRAAYSNVNIFARESYSFQNGHSMSLGQSLELVPDLVCSLVPQNSVKRHQQKKDSLKVLVIRRADHERRENQLLDELIRSYESNPKVSLKYTDTVVDVPDLSVRSTKKRQQIVNDKISEIAKADIVVTDRLHGMLLSRVARIPVIAFDNSTHKIKHTVSDWLGDDQGVLFVNSSGDVKQSVIEEWYVNAVRDNRAVQFDFELLTNRLRFHTGVNG